MTETKAMLAEGLGTFVLVLGIFALTDARNARRPPASIVPVLIGALLAGLTAETARSGPHCRPGDW